jgi:recombination DNA repair RAD52 pathway protein
MFTEEQLKALQAPLDRGLVKQRQGANRQTLSYLEAWQAIDEANRLFQYNWSRETVLLEPLHDPQLIRDEDDPTKTKVVAAYLAKVRVTVWSLDGQRSIIREGCGAARGFAKTVAEAMEQALKSAEADATKRALATLAYATGLALYDREQRHVTAEPRRLTASQEKALAPIDQGFDHAEPQPRQPISQRALASSRSPPVKAPNGRGPLPY